MELQTQRLKIIPCTEQSLQTCDKSNEYEAGPHIRMYLEELKENPSLLGWGVWLVILKKEDIIIGDIGFKGKPNQENTIEVGYGLVPSAQNKGYATEAVSEVIKWAFSFDNVEKIVAECLDDNLSSIRVLEKLEMKRTEPEKNMLKWHLTKARYLTTNSSK